MTTEVGFLALKALIVVQVVKGELPNILKVFIFGVLESFIQVEALMLGTLYTLVEDLPLQVLSLVDERLDPGVARRVDPLVAGGALGILEVDRETVPLTRELLPHAVHVEGVLALELDHRLLTKPLHVADHAERVSVVPVGRLLVLRHAVLMQAGCMHRLQAVAVAGMAALEEGSAALPGLVLAVPLTAEVHL